MQDFFFSNGCFFEGFVHFDSKNGQFWKISSQDAEASSDALEGLSGRCESCWVFPTKEVLETIWHPKLSIVVP